MADGGSTMDSLVPSARVQSPECSVEPLCHEQRFPHLSPDRHEVKMGTQQDWLRPAVPLAHQTGACQKPVISAI